MNNMRFKIIIAFLSFCIYLLPAFAVENLMPNTEFKSRNNKIPDKWYVSQGKFPVYKTQDGILSISGNSGIYTNSASINIPVNGNKNYLFSIQVKIDKRIKKAVIYYIWRDKNNKALGSARPAAYLSSPTSGWITVSKVLSPGQPKKTAKLGIILGRYVPKGKQEETIVEFKAPILTIIDKSDIEKTRAKISKFNKKQKASAFATLSNTSFDHNLTRKEIGQPYYLENSRPGWLALSTKRHYNKKYKLRLTVPTELEVELFLLHVNDSHGRLITPTSQKFTKPNKIISYLLSNNINWRAWGNGIAFIADSNIPDTFSIGVEFLSDKGLRLANFNIKIIQIPAAKNNILPKEFHARTWYNYPLKRILCSNAKGKIPEIMLKNWLDSGFMGGDSQLYGAPEKWNSYCNLVLPYSRKKSCSLPAAINGNGSSNVLICPSALNREGLPFYEKILRSGALYKKLISNKYDLAVVDYEPYVRGNNCLTCCFCKECLKNFALENNLKDENLSAEVIRAKYAKAWTEFRCKQNMKTVKAMRDAVAKINPALKFCFCSMPMPSEGKDEAYFQSYGINPRLYDSIPGLIFAPMNYSQTLLFYKRLERDVKELKSPVIPVIDNGWGNFDYHPQIAQLQITAIAFMGCKAFYIARGAMNMDGLWFKLFKETMYRIAQCEQMLNNSKLVFDKKSELRVIPGLNAKDRLYSIVREFPDHKSFLVLLINNDLENELYAKIALNNSSGKYTVENVWDGRLLSPDGKQESFTTRQLKSGFMVKLQKASCMLLRIKPLDNTGTRVKNIVSTEQIQNEEKQLAIKRQSIFKQIDNNGMTGRLIQDGYEISTPSQKLLIKINQAAIGTWTVKGKKVISELGRDGFIAPQIINFKSLSTHLDNVSFQKNSVTACFSFKLNCSPYQGLKVLKTFELMRNKPEIKVSIAVIPEGGYRRFRYRTCHILGLAQHATNIWYKIPQKNKVLIDKSLSHAVYYRMGVAFPNNKPFFHSLDKKAKVFSGTSCEALNAKTGKAIRALFGTVDELFMWRSGNDATLEWIYPNAYKDNDPHKVKTWSTIYTLQYKK